MRAAKGGLEEAAYREARASCLTETRSGGIDAVLCEHGLDALVTLTSGRAGLYRGLPVGAARVAPRFLRTV